MYIQWKRKLLRRGSGGKPDQVSFRAHVMESQWINNRSEKRSIVYLGAIREKNLSDPNATWAYWKQAEKKLALFVACTKMRAKLRAEIAKVVPNQKGELAVLCARALKNLGVTKRP